MKWFKHLVSSGDDPDIDDAISLFGAEAYYVFFRTLEIMSREFDYENPGKNQFSVVFFRKKFRVSWQKVTKILRFFDGKGRIFFQFKDGDKLGEVSLYCPKLKELCDEHTRRVMGPKSGVNQESLRIKSHTEAEAEAEADYLKADRGAIAIKKIEKNIEIAIGEIAIVNRKMNYDFDVKTWVAKWKKANGHLGAILESLNKLTCRMIDKSKPQLKNPFGYVDIIMKRVNGNYWESENQKIAQNMKNGNASGKLKELTTGIG